MAKSIFSWDPDTYTLQALESISRGANKDDWAAIRTEYTRLRDIAHKRISRLGKSEFNKTEAYRSHIKKEVITDPETGKKKVVVKDAFPKLKDLDPRDIPAAMAEMVKFLKAKTSTVSGQRSRRAKTIKAWQEQGLNLNEKNYNKVMAVMREMRTRKIVYGSDKVLTLVETTMEKRWNFNKILHSEKLNKLLENANKVTDIPKAAGNKIDEYVSKELGW